MGPLEFRARSKKLASKFMGRKDGENSAQASTSNASESTPVLQAQNEPAPTEGDHVDVDTKESRPFPIRELWDEAYKDLKNQECNLVSKYEEILNAVSKLNGTIQHTAESHGSQEVALNRRIQMEEILRSKLEGVDKNSWKLKFGTEGADIALKDLATPVLGIIDWANDYIGNALSSNPYAAIAWSGVGLLLPILLNPTKQAVSLAEGLKYISKLIALSLVREDLYYRRYETASQDTDHPRISKANGQYRATLKELYLRILKFHAKTVCYYAKNISQRVALDVVKWDDWATLLGDIKEQEEYFGSANELSKDAKYEEDCQALDQRHKESMTHLNSIGVDVSRLRTAIEDAQRDGQRIELLEWLSDVHPSENYNNARERHKEDTGEWLIRAQQFESWKKDPCSFLWLHGKAGSGKSILSSSVIEHLQDLYGDDPRTALAYFYFSFNDSKKQSTSIMLSSLVKQLCFNRPDCPESVKSLKHFKDKGDHPDSRTLERTLSATIQGFSNIFIVIDALDECPYLNDEREKLLSSLSRIQDISENLHLLSTSRKEPDIEAAFHDLWSKPSKTALDLSSHKADVDTDIGLYMDLELSSPKYKSWPAKIKDNVKEALIEKADGMFQYVVCQFDILKKHRSPNGIEQVLKDLPKGLDATYDRMLTNIDPDFQEKVSSVLKWLAFSQRPLMVEELAEAFILDYTLPVPFDESGRLFEPSDVLKYLPGVVTATEVTIDRYQSSWDGHKTIEIRFAHFSIKEYLVSHRVLGGPAAKFSISTESAQMHLAESCLAYHLHISEIELATQEHVKQFALWEYAAWYLGRHMEEIVEKSWTASVTEKVLQVFASGSRTLLNMIRFRDPDYNDDSLWSKEFDRLGPPLCYAASLDLPRIASLLIDHGADLDDISDVTTYGTALQTAAYHENESIVKLLIEKGADINAKGGYYGNALQAAAYHGNKDIVELLLEKGADVNAQGGFYGNALQAAAYWGTMKKDRVELLLEKGADVNAEGGFYGNALQAAACTSKDIVEFLLEKAADVNAEGGFYGNALQAAAHHTNKDIVELLLEKGADINAKGGFYGNALQAATLRGHKDIVELLLEKGADVNAEGGCFGNALFAAVANEEYDIARLLMSRGAKADVDEERKKEVRRNVREEYLKGYANKKIDRLERFWEDPEKVLAELEEEKKERERERRRELDEAFRESGDDNEEEENESENEGSVS